jgi:hypothetical protein
VRKSVSILIEKWSFGFKFDFDAQMGDKGGGRKFRRKLVIKKLSTLIRSVYSYTRLLPAFNFRDKQGFDYKLKYKLFYNIDQNLSIDNSAKKYKNSCDFLCGSVIMQVEFLSKQSIFYLEDQSVRVFILICFFRKAKLKLKLIFTTTAKSTIQRMRIKLIIIEIILRTMLSIIIKVKIPLRSQLKMLPILNAVKVVK